MGNETTGLGQITKVSRHHIEIVNIYEVSESELKELEVGNDADTFLNIGMSCVSFALACLLSALTSSFENDFWKIFTCCLIVIFGLAGLILLILWRNKRKSKSNVIETIRNRVAKD